MTFQPDETLSLSEHVRRGLGCAIVRANAIALACGLPSSAYCLFVDEANADAEVLMPRAVAERLIFKSDRKGFVTLDEPLAARCEPDEYVVVFRKTVGGAAIFKVGLELEPRVTETTGDAGRADGDSPPNLSPELRQRVFYAEGRYRVVKATHGFRPRDVCLFVDEAWPMGHDVYFTADHARARFPAHRKSIGRRLEDIARGNRREEIVPILRERDGRMHITSLPDPHDFGARAAAGFAPPRAAPPSVVLRKAGFTPLDACARAFAIVSPAKLQDFVREAVRMAFDRADTRGVETFESFAVVRWAEACLQYADRDAFSDWSARGEVARETSAEVERLLAANAERFVVFFVSGDRLLAYRAMDTRDMRCVTPSTQASSIEIETYWSDTDPPVASARGGHAV